MKQINQFIRTYIDVDCGKLINDKSINKDLIEIYDSFTEAYKWHGTPIAPPFEIVVFYTFLKTVYDIVDKYEEVFVKQSEVEVQKLAKRLNCAEIRDLDEISYFIYDFIDHNEIEQLFKDISEEYFDDYTRQFECYWIFIVINIFIIAYRCSKNAFPHITTYLIAYIEHYFNMPEKCDLTVLYNTYYDEVKKIRFDGKAHLKNIDIKKLYEILTNGNYISEIPLDSFTEVLNTPEKTEERINWKSEEYAAACAKIIFQKTPMKCAEMKFTVKNKILDSRVYTNKKQRKMNTIQEKKFKDLLGDIFK